MITLEGNNGQVGKDEKIWDEIFKDIYMPEKQSKTR